MVTTSSDQVLEFILPDATTSWTKGVLLTLEDMFMPVDWRESCTDDYLTYQTYDSLQAIFSSISGMIASRETLVSIGVSRADATVGSALFLEVSSEAVSRIVSILFSWKFSKYLDAECKRYRLLADIFNDLSLVLSTASSAVPNFYLRASIIITAASLRALCGVCAGSSKAALTNHFARSEKSVADISAKDSSQETIIYLIGLALGSLLVPLVNGRTVIWYLLLFLISLHLWANYKAVRNVHMTSLNLGRLCILLSAWLSSQEVATPSEVAASESILLKSNWLDLVWLKTSHLPAVQGRPPTFYAGNKVAIFRGDRGVLYVSMVESADHRDLIRGTIELAQQMASSKLPHITIDQELTEAGWQLNRDTLCYDGLRYKQITKAKKEV